VAEWEGNSLLGHRTESVVVEIPTGTLVPGGAILAQELVLRRCKVVGITFLGSPGLAKRLLDDSLDTRAA
jgi:hypothetical protein